MNERIYYVIDNVDQGVIRCTREQATRMYVTIGCAHDTAEDAIAALKEHRANLIKRYEEDLERVRNSPLVLDVVDYDEEKHNDRPF